MAESLFHPGEYLFLIATAAHLKALNADISDCLVCFTEPEFLVNIISIPVEGLKICQRRSFDMSVTVL